jgi:hypothetical protein
MCLATAAGLLSGCMSISPAVTVIPGSVSFNIAQAGEGDKYQLVCLASHSGSCHIRIETADNNVHFATVGAGKAEILEYAVVGAKFCISDSDPGSLLCKMRHFYFGPGGSFILRS